MIEASPARDRWPVEMDPNGLPIGAQLSWTPPPVPPNETVEGTWCHLEPLSAAAHSSELHQAFSDDSTGALWTWMGWGPFADEAAYTAWVTKVEGGTDPHFLAVIDEATGTAVGLLAFLRIAAADGCIEIGAVTFSPQLQRTTAATEAIAMLLDWAFEAGYRRVEWKCDSLNAASTRAARRLGFRYEGEFLQARVVKGRNRDTTWFSITDSEWPVIRDGLDRWLDPGNFDTDGSQLTPLDVRQED